MENCYYQMIWKRNGESEMVARSDNIPRAKSQIPDIGTIVMTEHVQTQKRTEWAVLDVERNGEYLGGQFYTLYVAPFDGLSK